MSSNSYDSSHISKAPLSVPIVSLGGVQSGMQRRSVDFFSRSFWRRKLAGLRLVVDEMRSELQSR